MNLETLVLPLKSEDNAFRASIARVTQLVQGAIQAVEGAIKASFEWADQLDSITDVMDVSTKSAAAYNFILRKSGTSTETFTKGMVILGKGLVDAQGKLDTTGKALKEWGIDVLDANGMLKDQETLIGEVANRYGEFTTQQEKVNFLTEVFGKSGAELVDFFDTLAADGGIAAVTKRVEELGLAIDPDRYEQFNRNLEEMKLIGLSLAVGFTEKVMPMLEDLTEWLMEKGIPGFMKFKDGLVAAFEEGGLGEALSFLDTEISNALDNIAWEEHGAKFGEMIEGLFVNASGEIDIPASLESLTQGISDFFIAAVGEENMAAFKNHFVDYILLQLDILNAQAVPKVKALMDGFWAEHSRGLEVLTVLWNGWSTRTMGIFSKWGGELLVIASNTMSSIQANIAAKLSAISENFQQRASSWLKKAAEIFNDTKGTLINAVATLVGEINNELKKIIQSFTLNIKAIFTGSGGSTPIGTAGTASLNTSNEGSGNTSGRASGGPTIGGQSYKVHDTFRPEIFTSPSSGRIDVLQSNGGPIHAVIDNWDNFPVAQLATEIVKAGNNT